MKTSKALFCKQSRWHGRKAFILGNEVLRLTTLTGGGHIAEVRLVSSEKRLSVNPLWTPPWPTIDPQNYREKKHSRTYGTITEGKVLSGLAGHNICLDYFGSPSVEESQQGLSQHGEAAWSKWRLHNISERKDSCALTLSVQLPVCGLGFSRKSEVRSNEPIVYFTETVRNERKADHFFHWAQHITLGSPFLSNRNSRISIPGTKGFTYPHGYDEGKALLASGKKFRWPNAPLKSGKPVDLTRPFLRDGLGFVAAVLLDKKREFGFVAAINTEMSLLVAYCFRRNDFPWVAIWEENMGISAPPWKQRTRARGLEFSTTPLPVHRRESFTSDRLFGEPNLTFVPARGEKIVRYLSFVTKVPANFGAVRDIRLSKNEIMLQGSGDKNLVTIAASRLDEHLARPS